MKFVYSHDLAPPGLVISIQVRGLGNSSPEEVPAKIDTGADISAIPEATRTRLRLPPQGHLKCRGFGEASTTSRPTYFVEVEACGKTCGLIEVVTIPRDYCLLGRDLLNQFVLLANGPALSFELT